MKLREFIDRKNAAEERFMRAIDAPYDAYVTEVAENTAKYNTETAQPRNEEAWDRYAAQSRTIRDRCIEAVNAALDGFDAAALAAYAEAPTDAQMRRISAFQMRANPTEGDVSACVASCADSLAALLALSDIVSAKDTALARHIPPVPDMSEIGTAVDRMKSLRESRINGYLDVKKGATDGRGADSVLAGTGYFLPGDETPRFKAVAAQLEALGK